MEKSFKGGRPPLPDRCDHLVKVRFNTDKSLATYCAKLSEFFAQFRTVGVNYNLIVKELRTEFSEKKAMQYLYRLEKATIEMANILAEVKALTVKFDEVWSQKSL